MASGTCIVAKRNTLILKGSCPIILKFWPLNDLFLFYLTGDVVLQNLDLKESALVSMSILISHIYLQYWFNILYTILYSGICRIHWGSIFVNYSFGCRYLHPMNKYLQQTETLPLFICIIYKQSTKLHYYKESPVLESWPHQI